MAPITLLIIHQSAELYGSDRSLLDLLSGLDRSQFVPIVCIPEYGPLAERLQALAIEFHITPLLKVRRQTFTAPWLLPKLPGAILRSLRGITTLVNGRKIDLVYTNTLAVMAGALWAAQHKVPHVWHVREILNRPLAASIVFRRLVSALSDRVICNSEETRCWIAPRSSVSAVTVWNGVESISLLSPLAELRARARAKFDLLPDIPVVLVIGRINARKGQDLVLDALEMMGSKGCTPFHLMFVGGGVPGETRALDLLLARIAGSNFSSHISVHPFSDQVADYYLAADIFVLPSRHPESFGRVAIEAMSYALPVIAAAHGGVLEIVEDERTGLFFQPNNAEALSSQLTLLLKDGELRRQFGLAGRERQRALFSVESYVEKLQEELLLVLQCPSEND